MFSISFTEKTKSYFQSAKNYTYSASEHGKNSTAHVAKAAGYGALLGGQLYGGYKLFSKVAGWIVTAKATEGVIEGMLPTALVSFGGTSSKGAAFAKATLGASDKAYYAFVNNPAKALLSFEGACVVLDPVHSGWNFVKELGNTAYEGGYAAFELGAAGVNVLEGVASAAYDIAASATMSLAGDISSDISFEDAVFAL